MNIWEFILKRNSLVLFLLLATVGLFASGQSEVIYVNANATESSDNGKDWGSAFTDLQDALDEAKDGDSIWVAAGVYTPSADDTEVSFVMKDGVDLYGGFNGTETELTNRDWVSNVTILSGEIGSKDSLKDNSKTVVMAANSLIDGFTITAGYGKSEGGGPGAGGPPPSGGEGQSAGHMSPDAIQSGGSSPGNGSGIQIWKVSPEIRNCIITENTSGKAGGVYIVGNFAHGSDAEQEVVMPLFVNCEITNNVAMGRGGGAALDLGGSALFIDTIFSGNECTNGKGGAVYNDFGCSPYFINCLFEDNFAQSGGAMGNDGASNPVIYRSTFLNNEASAVGAALYQGSGPFNDPRIVDSEFIDNICLEDETDIYSWNDCNPLIINSETGDKGYDSIAHKNRTEEEVNALIELVMAVPLNDDPTILDISNPTEVAASSDLIFVSADGSGSGESWDNPAALQNAIDMANLYYESTENSVSIWLKSGTYLAGDNRSDSFILREGVELYGGFNGSETSVESRNIETNVTVLSGDIGVIGVNTDNSYHVLIGSDSAILDGFTITGGYADGSEVYDTKGGAILNYHGGYRVRPDLEPLLGFNTVMKNIVFTNNYAKDGGAVYTYHGGNPVFESCVFINNKALYGAATMDRGGVNSTYTDCEFINNEAEYKAGAVFVDYGSMATFSESTFSNNVAGTSGGAIYVIDRASQAIPNETDIQLVDPTWTLTTDIFSTILANDCSFNNNIAGIDGGAIYIYESSNAKISGTSFTANESGRNGDNIILVNKAILYLSEGNSITSDDGIYVDDTSKITLD